MAIDLRDITDAVQTDLNKKVTVAITDLTPAEGQSVNPGESFDVHLEATNADSTAGGVALKNLKYRVAASGGSTKVNVRVLADVDLDELFPPGEDTPVVTKSLTVVG